MQSSKIHHAFLALALLVCAVSTGHADAAEAMLEQAIAGAHRGPASVERDPYRHPQETLRFFGIRPDMTVVETLPGSGWYTEILAPYLRDKGQLLVATMSMEGLNDYLRNREEKYHAMLDAQPDIYGKVQRIIYKKTGYFDDVKDGTVDMIVDFRNIHNYVRFGGGEDIFKAYYRILKSGGVLGITDHRANAGSDVKETAQKGYVTEEYVIGLAEQAGLKLAGKSEINANPKDTKDYPDGVWTLPPGYRLGGKDKEKYAAIGESDRLTLKFIKP